MSSPDTPIPAPETQIESSEIDKTILEQMNSEYAILQDKLDKIGGFRTTIRGWSVTLVIASIIAAGSSKQVSSYSLSILFLFIYAFYAMERKQNQYGAVFGARALHLEKQIRSELRKHHRDSSALGFYPGIAHHIHGFLKNKSLGYILWLTDPDQFFYILQGLAVVFAMVVLIFLGTDSKSPDIQNVVQTTNTLPVPPVESGTITTTVDGLKTHKAPKKNAKEKNN